MTNQVTDRVEIDLPAAAIGLSAFRVLKNGEGRQHQNHAPNGRQQVILKMNHPIEKTGESE